MLFKMIVLRGGNYRVKLKRQAGAAIVLLIAGLCIFALSFSDMLVGVFENEHFESFTRGFYCGTGLGVAVASILCLIQVFRQLRNEEAFRKGELEATDERNQYIRLRTGYTSIWILGVLVYFATILAGFFNFAVFLTLLCLLLSGIVVVLVCYAIFRRCL